MSRFLRLPTKDPRTIARDIPGISQILFPQLTSGFVGSLNKTIRSYCGIKAIDESLIQQSSLRASVLFEFSYVIAEKKLNGKDVNYNQCFDIAVEKQNRYYDYVANGEIITDLEIKIGSSVATNLVGILKNISERKRKDIIVSPYISGYEWIANSRGDFSIGDSLIEVKCSNKNFSSLDYRQILIYFLLNYIKTLSSSTETCYQTLILVNPRLNKVVEFNADDLLFDVSAGRSKIEVIQQFFTIIKERYDSEFL